MQPCSESFWSLVLVSWVDWLFEQVSQGFHERILQMKGKKKLWYKKTAIKRGNQSDAKGKALQAIKEMKLHQYKNVQQMY